MDSSPRPPQDAFAWSPPTDSLDLGPGAGGWTDPIDERTRDRRRIRFCLLAFALLGFALVLASVGTVGGVLAMFRGMPGGVFPESWKFAEASLVVWCSFVGTCLLWGRWRDASWQRRAGLLVLMGFVDLILWSLEFAVVLGLSEQGIDHEWFRHCLGHALGWAELSLIASLAADVADHLGSPQALDIARGARALASVGATLWLAVIFFCTRWTVPFWPLRMRPMFRQPELQLMMLGETVLYTINLVQITALTLLAAYACTVALRNMIREDRSLGKFDHPSESAWDEFHRNRP
ncbi:hypothetical protein TA3x_003204 [Tundrisphaera sp. TA3]|uniref:hypothetical protein n=1 Tax=Tundrisphaera sp. TA3 TaxID=3435775 RepID=UPI003EBD4ED7